MSNSRAYQVQGIADTYGVSSNVGAVSLASLNSKVLPDGYVCFVLERKIAYRLDKTLSVPTPGSDSGGQLGAVGGGVWVPIQGTTSSPGSVSGRNSADKAITLTGVGNFLTMPSSAATFVAAYAGTYFALDTASGRLTYTGPTGARYFFSINASMYNGTTVIDTLLGLQVVSTVQSQQSKATSPVATGASSFYALAVSGFVTLTLGDTLDVVFAGDSSTLTITNVNYSLIPLN